jgi:hypothetical protein
MLNKREDDLFALMPVGSLVVMRNASKQFTAAICRVLQHWDVGERETKHKFYDYRTGEKVKSIEKNSIRMTQIVTVLDFKTLTDDPTWHRFDRKPTKLTVATVELYPVTIVQLGTLKLKMEELMKQCQV